MRLRSATFLLSLLVAPVAFADPRAYVLSAPSTGAGNLDLIDASGAPSQHHFVTRFGVSSRNWYLVADSDHQRIYTTGEGNAFIETMDTCDSFISTLPGLGLNNGMIAALPDGQQLALVNPSAHEVVLLNRSTLATAHIAIPVASGDAPYGIAALPDGSALYVTTDFAAVFRIDLSTRVASLAAQNLGGPQINASIVAAPDSSAVFVANTGTVWKLTVPTHQRAEVNAGQNPFVEIRELALTPDGGTLYAAQLDNVNSPPRDRLHRIDTNKVSSVSLSAHPLSVAVHPDGATVYVALAGASSISMFDGPTMSFIGTVGTDPNPVRVRFANVPPLDFRMSVSPTTLSIAANDSASVHLSTVACGGNRDIQLRLYPPPGVVAGQYDPTTVAAGAGVDLGFAVILGTPPGPKNPITIVGSNGLDTHAVTIDVTTTACVPTTCQGSGFQCGSLSDNCGQTLSCGECAGTGDVCSGGQCVPRRCTAWRRCPKGSHWDEVECACVAD